MNPLVLITLDSEEITCNKHHVSAMFGPPSNINTNQLY